MGIYSKSQTRRTGHRYIAAMPHPYYEPGPKMTKKFAWFPTETESGRIVWFKFFYIRKEIDIEGSGKIVWSTEFYTAEDLIMLKLKGS